MKKTILTFLIALLLVMPACNNINNRTKAPDEIKANTVIIKINGDGIKKDKFDDTFNEIYQFSPFGQFKINLAEDKNKKIRLFLTEKAVQDILSRYFVQKEIEKRKITVTDKDVDDLFNNLALQKGGKEKLLDQIKTSNLTEEKLKTRIKDDLLAKKLIDQLSENISITDKEAKDFYTTNKQEKFNVPENSRVSHILIKIDENDVKKQLIDNFKKNNPTATKEEIQKYESTTLLEDYQKLIKQKEEFATKILNEALQKSDKFPELALKYSEDRLTANNGGDLGYIAKGKTIPELNNIIFDKKKAQVGKVYKGIITTNAGLHIIKITDHRNQGIIPFEPIKENIKRILLENKKIEVLNKFINDKKSTAKIEYEFDAFDINKINDKIKELNSPSNAVNNDIMPKKATK